jgi:adenylate kinase
MRAIVTGVSGTRRSHVLASLAEMAEARGQSLQIYDVREAMFQIAEGVGQAVEEETVLDMFPPSLVMLRAAALEKLAGIVEQVGRSEHWVLITHAVFRWKNTLISGFDPYYLGRLKPDLYITVTEGVRTVRSRLLQQPRWETMSHEQLLVWREEEQFATEELARMQRKPQYLVGERANIESIYRLFFEPKMRKAYLSYPMTHGEGGVERGLQEFKERLEENLIVFDPADVNDFDANAKPTSESNGPVRTDGSGELAGGEDLDLTEEELQHVADQIVFRDYKLIAQSDMIVVFYDLAVASPGVVSEMNYALHTGKRVYGVWLPEADPSPFFSRYCSRVFRSTDELFQYFARYRITSGARPLVEAANSGPDD